LKSEQQISLTKYIKSETKTRAKKKEKSNLDFGDIDESLLDVLKKWRAQQARKQAVPAYIVFPDKTLKQIASAHPKTKTELLGIDGIGKVKLEKYGDVLLELLSA